MPGSPFPPDFWWGASTSAYQVEGGNCNSDWYQFERNHAERLAKAAGPKHNYGLGPTPVWDEIAMAAKNPDNYRCGEAVDHWNRFAEDYSIAHDLNFNMLRSGIEWSRVHPQEYKVDFTAIRHYQAMAQAQRVNGLEPMVTLWHFTLPLWIARQGGWENPATTASFLLFVSDMVDALKDDVRYWITINEPEVYTLMGYLLRQWPPQGNPLKAKHVMDNLIRAHNEAYALIKHKQPEAQVGAAVNNTWFDPAGGLLAPINRLEERLAHRVYNRYFLDHTHEQMDFIGLNHYQHCRINGLPFRETREARSDLGWLLCPEGVARCAWDIWMQYGRAVIVTENGLADHADRFRATYIEQVLEELGKVIGEGAEIHGYLHWSLLHNFEWDKGFWPDFGLVTVDRENGMKRTVKDSAHHYAKLIERYRQ